MRLRVLILSLLAMAFFGSVAAHAHAMLDHASPIVGSTVPTAREVALTFSQNLEAAFSSIQVTNANGARVDQGKPQVSGNTMRVGLKILSPGTYRVRWQALSVDTHKTEGSFTFTVGGR